MVQAPGRCQQQVCSDLKPDPDLSLPSCRDGGPGVPLSCPSSICSFFSVLHALLFPQAYLYPNTPTLSALLCLSPVMVACRRWALEGCDGCGFTTGSFLMLSCPPTAARGRTSC
uniref:Uncharacterized protein n=1 Tax=Eutreptiella gymnastica TaxID=73025 RepID=A0A7S1I7S5_9EUGL|mmetsp:Transcript_135706/g.235516  ORF Transcript_135706/g.235516 Transcript_135706/m.235516 type:complete len:114 (+) Transcript_135706:206-547(+)